jgi:hypothetical protein
MVHASLANKAPMLHKLYSSNRFRSNIKEYFSFFSSDTVNGGRGVRCASDRAYEPYNWHRES